MEDKYQHFHMYDFHEDDRFRSGWKTIEEGMSGDDDVEREERLLQAKIFFYSKFFESVSKEEYQRWVAMREKSNHGDTKTKYPVTSHDDETPLKSSDDTKTHDTYMCCNLKNQPAVATPQPLGGAREKSCHTIQPSANQNTGFVDVFPQENCLHKDQTSTSKVEQHKVEQMSPECDHSGTKDSESRVLKASEENDNVHFSFAEVRNILSNIDSQGFSQGENAQNVKKENESDSNCASTKRPITDEQMVGFLSGDKDLSLQNNSPYDDDGHSNPITLEELMGYLQRGESIPGVQELNISPTNTDPSLSKLQRIKKPWEA